MPLHLKALTAAFLLTAVLPVAASAQSPVVQQGGIWPIEPVVTPVEAQDCGASQYEDYVGQSIDDVTVPPNVAIILPDAVRGTIHLPLRLNFVVTPSGTIQQVFCG